jgi:hypothetical protein
MYAFCKHKVSNKAEVLRGFMQHLQLLLVRLQVLLPAAHLQQSCCCAGGCWLRCSATEASSCRAAASAQTSALQQQQQ